MESLRIVSRPPLRNARMVMGLDGWMDSGRVSTGVIDCLVETVRARRLAEINPRNFYIYNFPGPMEVSSMFRPHTHIEEGIVLSYREPANTFRYNEEHRLILFKGKEPNLQWQAYADCLFAVAETFQVTTLCFVGSVAGLVPHTRTPRFFGTISDIGMQPLFARLDVAPSSYEGPASLVTYLLTRARELGLNMFTLVAEVPAYIEGTNAVCIEAALRRVTAALDLSLDLSAAQNASEEFRRRIDDAMREKPDLAELLRKIEDQYNKEHHAPSSEELRTWFERQGFSIE